MCKSLKSQVFSKYIYIGCFGNARDIIHMEEYFERGQIDKGRIVWRA
jgi:hypothetical protein